MILRARGLADGGVGEIVQGLPRWRVTDQGEEEKDYGEGQAPYEGGVGILHGLPDGGGGHKDERGKEVAAVHVLTRRGERAGVA
jgi:hypothetical protein